MRGLRLFGTCTRTLALALGILLLGLPVFSQSSAGRILGDVRDPSNAVIVGAAIEITDVQRGVSRTLVTDSAGEYVAPNLDPGTYTITVTNSGFKRFERTNVQVEVATDVRIDIVLQPGDATQTVVVNEEIPLLNTTSSTLGGTLSNQEINDLPLNGRNYENLLQLRPGVVRYPGGGFSTTSTNGLRAEDNVYIVDGLFNSEPFSGQSIINGAGIAGDSATILPIDAIQEFNLIENPPAEYGWKPGAIVNVGLKSGTNGLHGTGFAFGRDTPLDARNFFNTDDQPKQPRNLEQFGGTVGGPIKKDKLFFFGGYEGQRYVVGNVGQIQTPATVGLPTPATPTCSFTTGDCANSLVDAIRDLQAHGTFISPASLQIGGCTLGPPVSCNGTGFPTNLGTNPAGPTTINFGLPNSVNSDNAIGKIDYHLNDKNTISGRYFYGNNNGTVSDASQLQTVWLTAIHTRAQVFGINWTYVPNSQWVNEARYGYNRLYQPTFTNDHNIPASAYGLDTGVTNPLYGGLPRINIAPFYIFPQELGGFNWPKVQGPDVRNQFVDHVSRVFGKHAFKFGGEIHRDLLHRWRLWGRARQNQIWFRSERGSVCGCYFSGELLRWRPFVRQLAGRRSHASYSQLGLRWIYPGRLARLAKSNFQFRFALRAQYGGKRPEQFAGQLQSNCGSGTGGATDRRSISRGSQQFRPARRSSLGSLWNREDGDPRRRRRDLRDD